jgi:hypothetical protein
MKILWGFAVCLLLAACSEENNAETEASDLAEIAALEDSLQSLYTDPNAKQEEVLKQQKQLTDALLAFYTAYPESEESATCLDQASTTFADMGDYYKSVQWADTVLNRFPKYADRALMLESQAVSYDALIQPRDSAKVRFYYSMLLNEFPSLDKEKRKGIQKRLKHNHLSFDEFIELNLARSSDLQ